MEHNDTNDKTILENDSNFMDKYSRQIGTFGLETMAKLVRLRVLIIGMKGTGIECAKNLILAGPGMVTIYDDGICEMKDLGTNFFITEQDVKDKKKRSIAVYHRLSELNKMVTVKLHMNELTKDIIKQHDLVVYTNINTISLNKLIEINEFCRSQYPSIGFICSHIFGLVGFAFTDFGNQFIIHDAHGKNPINRIVTNIYKNNNNEYIIQLLNEDQDGKPHGLQEDEHTGWIMIHDVKGMISNENPNENINTLGPYRYYKSYIIKKDSKTGKEKKIIDNYSINIGKLNYNLSNYESGGTMIQYLKPYNKKFCSLKDALYHPVDTNHNGLINANMAKFGYVEQLHKIILALLKYKEDNNNILPEVHNIEQANIVLKYALESTPIVSSDRLIFNVDNIDKDLVIKAALYSQIEFQPLCSFFGGIIAQEIVKFTGKYQPLDPFLHLSAFEVLPSNLNTNHLKDYIPMDSRYDYIIQLFGKTFLENKLMNAKTFMVGCGALGCEYLKNFAMVGLACSKNGLITVTDNDRIEISNLNRQFLFRDNNIGQSKSIAATNAVKLMNKDIHINALEHLVSVNTEHIFNDSFWENNIDFVTNALDNVKARLYVDSKCVFYKKPLIESGTLGTECNVLVVLPHLTASYSDGPKDSDNNNNIPMCTLRNFPSIIEHCIEWARAQFEDLFNAPIIDVKNFIENPILFLDNIKQMTINHSNKSIGYSGISQELIRLKTIKTNIEIKENINYFKCIELAFDLFFKLFRDKILQLIHNFPENHITNSNEKFWSGAKKFPQAAVLIDLLNNPYHLNFIISTSNLYAVTYGLHPLPENKLISKDDILRKPDMYIDFFKNKYKIPTWCPTNEKIAENEEELKKLQIEKEIKNKNDMNQNNPNEINEFIELINYLENKNLTNILFQPNEFEKDQDLNFHIDFIYSASNIRAWNYKIKSCERHKIKMIAGKIIPAIATTTACVTGLAMIEIFKIIQLKDKKLNDFMDSCNSLASNSYYLTEPDEPKKEKDEYDIVLMENIFCKPKNFTKWDSTIIIYDKLKCTLNDFLNEFKKVTDGLNCTLLYHKIAELGNNKDDENNNKYKNISGLMLYDKTCYYNKKLYDLYQSKLNTLLIHWIEERYEGFIEIKGNYIELQTSSVDDNDQSYKVPTVIWKFNK